MNKSSSTKAWVDFVVCLFLGWLGVHKFLEKKIGMGILYFLTFGLFCIGWLVDAIKYLDRAIRGEHESNTENLAALPREKRQSLLENQIITNPGLLLSDGEVCYYKGAAQSMHLKNVVVGRTGGGSGVSVRVAKGVSVHTGGSGSQNIRGNVAEKYDGTFFITSKRVILHAPKYGFELPFSSLTSIDTATDGFQFYSNGKCYCVLTREVTKIMPIMGLIEIESNEKKTARDTSYTDELRELKKLFDDGIITEAEYDAKKASLLKI